MGSILGYFIVMIGFMAVAILIAKFASRKLGAWIAFLIGALLQLRALIGTQNSIGVKLGFGPNMTLYWSIYIVLLVVTAIIIAVIKPNQIYTPVPDSFAAPKAEDKSADGWVCKNCGARRPK